MTHVALLFTSLILATRTGCSAKPEGHLATALAAGQALTKNQKKKLKKKLKKGVVAADSAHAADSATQSSAAAGNSDESCDTGIAAHCCSHQPVPSPGYALYILRSAWCTETPCKTKYE